MFHILLLVIAVIAGLGGWQPALIFPLLAKAGLRDTPRLRRQLQGVFYFALIMFFIGIGLRPLAVLTFLIALGMMVLGIFRDRMLAGLEQEQERPKDWASPPPAATGTMSHAEALQVLGLAEGADTEEINAAWKKLISQIHPDKGGTDYLAAKINEARKVLLDRAGQ